MNSTQIEQNLGYLNDHCMRMNIHVQLLLVGGALMVTQLKNRQNTDDIDVSIIASSAQEYSRVLKAIEAVAKDRHFPEKWINDDVSIITDQVRRPRTLRPWLRLSHLTVYLPDLEYMLGLKLLSGRAQDYRDIEALSTQLGLWTQEEAWHIINTYIPPHLLQDRAIQTRVERAIQQCFRKG